MTKFLSTNNQKNYSEKGTVLVKKDNDINPFSTSDLNNLTKYCSAVNKEFIQIGDAGEKNNLLVGRFMTDIKKPEIVKNPFSKKVINILLQDKVINFIKKVIGINDALYLRRVQFNQINKNNFVGYHLDTDSNPDYIAACVIQLGHKYLGGKYRVYQKDGSYLDYISSFGDLIISNCQYPHEVTKVESGNRKSLVFFMSKHCDKNERKN